MEEKEYRIIIGRRLAEIRKSKGYTVRKLAELSGMTYQNINRIEMGRYSVGIDILEKIIKALGYTIKIVEDESSTQDNQLAR